MITVISGGVDAARFLQGLARQADPTTTLSPLTGSQTLGASVALAADVLHIPPS